MNQTDICNMALSYLCINRINSLEDDTQEARECKTHYSHCRRKLLLAYPFGFAKHIDKLALLNQTEYAVPGWRYVYSYPENTLSVQYVYDAEHAERKEEQQGEYEILMINEFDRVIATNIEKAYAESIHDVKEPEIYSEEFIDALTHLLASAIALQLTGSANVQQTQLQLAMEGVEQAKLSSALEKNRRTHYPQKYANSRFR